LSSIQNQGADGALIYVAIGASDVVGEGADNPDTEAWPIVIYERLPKGTVIHRLGVSGSTAEEAIVEQLPAAETLEPNLVTIWLAINDIRNQVPLEAYRKHLDEIVRRMTDTGAQVFVGNVPDLRGIPELSESYRPDQLTAFTAEWNATIAEVVLANGGHLVDLQEASEGMEQEEMQVLISEDRFHPSTLGHVALAEIFLHHIESAF
jgi:lysophospholipase L1-like esterase